MPQCEATAHNHVNQSLCAAILGGALALPVRATRMLLYFHVISTRVIPYDLTLLLI